MSKRLLVVLLALTASLAAQQATPAAQAPLTLGTILERQLGNMENGFVDAAEAMPEDKYEWAPPESAGEFKGVRSFGDQVRHVTAGNFVFAAMVLGQTPRFSKSVDDMIKGVPAKGKAETVTLLKESFALAHQAMQKVTTDNLTEQLKFPFNDNKMSRMSAANIMLWHTMDHYGQMVIYLRMNGIVPPASRQN
jgi:uncharacterized damage-inducible protein DinB